MSFLTKITPRKIVLVIYNWIAWVYWQCVRWVKQIYNSINLPLYILEREGTDGGRRLSFAYAGFYNWSLEYWAQTALGSGFQKRSLGRKYMWDIFTLLQKEYANVNFLLIEHSSILFKIFTQKQGFYLPHWTYMDLDISLPIEKLFGRQRADIQRKIRKYSLNYLITNNVKDFDHFYYNMYLPYTKARHADESVIFSHQHLYKMFVQGGLIFIQKGNDIVGGGLFESDKKNARFRALGTLDGKWEYTQVGVISAVYYFLIVEMKKRGYTKILIGGARPLFSDGVSKFKMSIGARILSDNNDPGYTLFLNKKSPAVQDFFIKNPLAFFKHKKPYRAVFVHLDNNATRKYFDEMMKETNIPGLAGTELFCFNAMNDLPDHIEFPKNEFSVNPADNLFMKDPGAE